MSLAVRRSPTRRRSPRRSSGSGAPQPQLGREPCPSAQANWEDLLAERRSERREDEAASAACWEAEVKPWFRDLERKQSEQIGVRIADASWQEAHKQENRDYIAWMRRRHRARDDLIANRIEAKKLFVRELRKTQRMWLSHFGGACSKRGLPNSNVMDDATLKRVLEEVTAALHGELTDSVGGRRKKLIESAHEANIDTSSLHWEIILKVGRLPTVQEASDFLGSEEKLFRSHGRLADSEMLLSFVDGRKPVPFSSLADENNPDSIPGKFPPKPRPEPKPAAPEPPPPPPAATPTSPKAGDPSREILRGPSFKRVGVVLDDFRTVHENKVGDGGYTDDMELDLEVRRNEGGCEEPNSVDPELWNIDGTEVDMEASYQPGGQLWYLQDRAQAAVKAGRLIAGHPMNPKAVAMAKRHAEEQDAAPEPEPEVVQEEAKHPLEQVLDLANSWYMARGHLNRNWFRTFLATKSGGKYAGFVAWLCGDPAKAKDRTNRGTFRQYDTDHSGTIELDELQRAVAAYIEVERADPAVARPKAVQTPTPLTVGFVQTDYRRLRGTTPPAGSLRSFQGLTASCR